eukprot:TRINITY_DN873_c0_g1_i31.p1 TRINITY_DN873_c0_g1~~TRINITY_DN873_c0_g1_i31.p1  ORF type:complete len:312 (-),score=63.73 TRINITY_DN873_c0_g1_i31:86-1021(-)
MTDTLARHSFDLIREFASSVGPDVVDYRPVDALEMNVFPWASRSSDVTLSAKSTAHWINKNVNQVNQIGNSPTTAQIHPEKYTLALLQKAKDMGTNIVFEKVTDLTIQNNTITAVILANGEILTPDTTIIATGPWIGRSKQWGLSLPDIKYLKASSIVMEPKEEISAHACFATYIDQHGKFRQPEIYPRPDGFVYICGGSRQVDLPDNPDDILLEDDDFENLISFAANVSSHLEDCEIKKRQACYVPDSPDGSLILGEIPNTNNGYVAGGHGVWGILLSQVTGLLIAELIVDGKTRFDISSFEPSRFVENV